MNAERRAEVFQNRGENLGLHTQRMPAAITGNVITQYDDHLRLQLVGALDDRPQFSLVDKCAARVNIRQDRNAKFIQLSRPTIDLNSFMAHHQPVRFHKEPPEPNGREQQQHSR